MFKKQPFLLCVLDGVGLRESADGNAVKQASKQGLTPTLDALFASAPQATLRTDGPYVGLPEGQMGNSEVGHTTIGAGRVLKQSLQRITDDLGSKKDDLLIASKGKKAIHIIGLASDGGVHSHSSHILEVCRMLNAAEQPVYIHAITDGRDCAPKSALEQLKKFEDELNPLENVSIATIVGRYFAMDRDNREERTNKAYNLFHNGTAPHASTTAIEAIEAAYNRGETDEFIEPTLIDEKGLIQPDDLVVMANFRADRMRQITQKFIGNSFKSIITMTSYDNAFKEKVTTLFAPQNPKNVLGDVVSTAGKTQLRIAETEKYPHVTYFMNGGVREEPFEGEDRTVVPSPKVATYDLQPEMSLPEVANKTIKTLESRQYDLTVLNMANGDMVGHTGDLNAAVQAIAAVDKALGQVLSALKKAKGAALVLADHGNCEQMTAQNGGPHTAHTTNPVPLFLVDYRPEANLEKITLQKGALADIAPTSLYLMGLEIPAEMTGRVLVTSK